MTTALYALILVSRCSECFSQTCSCRRLKELLALVICLSISFAVMAMFEMTLPWYVKWHTESSGTYLC